MKEDAIRYMKGDIAAVVNYFEDDLSDEELINLSKDIERIAVNFAVEKCMKQRELCAEKGQEALSDNGRVMFEEEFVKIKNAPEPEFD